MPAKLARDLHLDALGLFLAGLINTFLALFDAVVILGPGTPAREPDLYERAAWIGAHGWRWQAGWLFWFAVTLSFAWSFFALGRHLRREPPWPALAVGLALIAAAVDLVGVVLQLTALPQAAALLGETAVAGPAAAGLFAIIEGLAGALINVAAFGLYTLAGLLLLPALWGTADYPRALCWLGTAEWSLAALATLLLLAAPVAATLPLLLSFALFAPWAWGSALWLLRRRTGDATR